MLSISSSSKFFVLFYLFYFLIDLFNFLFFIYFYFLTNETHFYLEKWKSNFKIISRWKNSLSYLVPFSKPSPRNKKNCPPPLSPPQKKKNNNKEKILIFQEIKLSGSNIKKYNVFSEESFTYICRNENPVSEHSYISRNGNSTKFLVFQKVTFRALKLKEKNILKNFVIFWKKKLSSPELTNFLILQDQTCKA